MSSKNSVDRFFSDWLVHRSLSEKNSARPTFSIAIQSPCVVCQPRIALKLADYLDEFDSEYNGGSWLCITNHRLEQIQAHAGFCKILGLRHCEDSVSFLADQGGVILELPSCHTETAANANVFQVSLSCQEPEINAHHLWINAKRIPEKTLIPMIANAFFDWASNDGDRKFLPAQKIQTP